MRDFHAHPGHKFGAMLTARKARGGTGADRAEGPAKAPEAGAAGNRPGKKSHPSGTSKHDKHKIKGKVRHVHAEAVHGGHKVTIGYHGKKGASGMGFGASEDHFHADPESAKQHMMDAMDQMEPEEADSSDLAQKM